MALQKPVAELTRAEAREYERLLEELSEEERKWVGEQRGPVCQRAAEPTVVQVHDARRDGEAMRGAFLQPWSDSIKYDGLRRMKRNHVHFAVGEPMMSRPRALRTRRDAAPPPLLCVFSQPSSCV